MAINWTALEARAREFNNQFHTNFNYAGFNSKMVTLEKLQPKKAADIVYKGTLGAMLKDAMIYACSAERNSPNGKGAAVDLMNLVKNFEEYLMMPFVKECKLSGESVYPKPFGGMSKKARIELVEHILNSSPKNDVEITARAYEKGQISLRYMREIVADMPFASGRAVDNAQLQRIGTIMLAIESVNKSRTFWWRVFHPIRNRAEKRDAKELRSVLNSFRDNTFGVNSLREDPVQLATKLATAEYATIAQTKESIKNAKAAIEKDNTSSKNPDANLNKNPDEIINQPTGVIGEDLYINELPSNNNPIMDSDFKDAVKIDVNNNDNTELSKKVTENDKKESPLLKKIN